jgi:putative membrane protein insertion efficiency factor
MQGSRLITILRAIFRIPAWILIGMARVYQHTLSPILGRRCRFHPTCSAYFIGAVQKYGAVRGGWRGFRRICRCHPWNPGGYDPP